MKAFIVLVLLTVALPAYGDYYSEARRNDALEAQARAQARQAEAIEEQNRQSLINRPTDYEWGPQREYIIIREQAPRQAVQPQTFKAWDNQEILDQIYGVPWYRKLFQWDLVMLFWLFLSVGCAAVFGWWVARRQNQR